MFKTRLIATLLALTSAAYAGSKSTVNVWVTTGSYGYAYGSLGSTRNSADSMQFIGCELGGTKTSSWAQCWARDTGGQYLACVSYVDHIKQAAGNLTDGGYVFFQIDSTDTSKCAYLVKQTSSRYAPPQL